MQVIKLGGSLSHSAALAHCLTAISLNQQEKTVIVPGGGDFANQVRLAQHRWQFNDRIAHDMAILAMQQMALLFKGLHPEFALISSITEIKKAASQPIIWSPSIKQLNQAQIQPSWAITSDSLAAWLAKELAADSLIVVKAAAVHTTNLAELTEQGILDKAFIGFVAHAPFSLHIVNQEHFYEPQLANHPIA